MNYFLGIDVGASKTHALIADEAGRCIGVGRAWGGNHQNVGYDGLEKVLQESFEQACQMSEVDPKHIAGAGFGVGGYDFPSERALHLKAIGALGLSCPVEVVNDGVIGLLAGATHGIGVNVTAGSSNNCHGRNREGKEGRIVGNGPTFGEYGGATEIVMKALHMVNYAWIKRTPPTSLTHLLLDATGAKDEMDLMEGISNHNYDLSPHIAVEVINAAQSGDASACEVMRWAGEELGWLAVSVARQIEMENEEVEVIQSGSIFKAGAIITDPMRDVVLKHCPKAKLNRLDGPPVVGAVILGMEQASFNGYSIRDLMIKTTKDFLD
jgi:N-acetylglucosamine kinase-like BadF-type ATPase